VKGKTIGKVHTIFDTSRFTMPGGDVVTFCVPNNFLNLLKVQEVAVKGSNRSKKSHNDLSLTSPMSNTTPLYGN